MLDLGKKIQEAEKGVKAMARGGQHRGKDTQLDKFIRDSNKIAGEEVTGLLASEVKAKLFNGVGAAHHQNDAITKA